MAPQAERHPVTAPLRIALVASSFAPHFGGVETHVAQVARGLGARGHAVEVWTVDRGIRPPEPFTVPVSYLPAPLPARSLPVLLQAARAVPKAWRSWRRAHRRFAPDVVAVQCFGPNGIYAAALHRVTSTPLVISSHGETLGDDGGVYGRSVLLRRSLSAAVKRAAAVTAPSTYVLDDLRSRFGLDGGTVIPNGVDLAVGRVPPASPRQPLVLAVGRLGRMKGFDLLIDAFARSGLDDARLEIIGDGPERERLEQQIDAAGLSERVSLAGEQDAAAVARRVGEAAAVVVPSRSESFGIVALEAWRGGAALVMTSRGGAVDFIRDDEDALLVDPEDTAALAAAIRSVMTDEQRRLALATRGSERVQGFGWGDVVDAYEELFRRVRAESA